MYGNNKLHHDDDYYDTMSHSNFMIQSENMLRTMEWIMGMHRLDHFPLEEKKKTAKFQFFQILSGTFDIKKNVGTFCQKSEVFIEMSWIL